MRGRLRLAMLCLYPLDVAPLEAMDPPRELVVATLLGTDPVPDTGGEVFPSDHFGVRVVLTKE